MAAGFFFGGEAIFFCEGFQWLRDLGGRRFFRRFEERRLQGTERVFEIVGPLLANLWESSENGASRCGASMVY